MPKKPKPKKLSIGECVVTFLGEVCKRKAGYRLTSPIFDGKLLADEDGEALAGGQMLGVDDLEEVEDPESDSEGSAGDTQEGEQDEDLHNGD